MPPRKSTSSVTPADPDDSLLQSPSAQQTEKPVFATEQQLKARAEAGVSVEVSQDVPRLEYAMPMAETWTWALGMRILYGMVWLT
jgi:hypothetical protein